MLRGFPLDGAEDFAEAVRAILGSSLHDYQGGEGARTKIVQGVYTSSEAPPDFLIPLHNELSCTDNPPAYICFFCEIAPKNGCGQTLLGRTSSVTEEVMKRPEIWNYFENHLVKYLSNHPPKGHFIQWLNPTHKSWQESFETESPEEADRLCQKMGFECTWRGDWLEIVRYAPATKCFEEGGPYWFNQIHLYHNNPRIRGGLLYYYLANLVYCLPSTRSHEVTFEGGEAIETATLSPIYDILEKETILFDWQKGDLLILDNCKTLHGRAPFQGPRRILVSMVDLH